MKFNCFFLLLSVFALIIGCEQKQDEIYYYENVKTGLISSSDDYVLNWQTKKMGIATFENLVIKEKFLDTITRNDSLIIKYEWPVSIDVLAMEDFKNSSEAELLGSLFPAGNHTTIDGKPFNLETLKGKPTLVNVWYVECKPCVDEIPALNKIAAIYKDKVNFISITYEDKNKARRFFAEHQFDFEHVVEARDILDDLNINFYPKNIILDRKGKIRHISGGIPQMSVNGEEAAYDSSAIKGIIDSFL